MQARRLQQRFSSTEASSTRTACSPLSLFLLRVGWIAMCTLRSLTLWSVPASSHWQLLASLDELGRHEVVVFVAELAMMFLPVTPTSFAESIRNERMSGLLCRSRGSRRNVPSLAVSLKGDPLVDEQTVLHVPPETTPVNASGNFAATGAGAL